MKEGFTYRDRDTRERQRALVHFHSLDLPGEQRKFSTRRGVFTLALLSLLTCHRQWHPLASKSDKCPGQRRFLVHVTYSTFTHHHPYERASWASQRASEFVERFAIVWLTAASRLINLNANAAANQNAPLRLTGRHHGATRWFPSRSVRQYHRTRDIAILIDCRSIWNQESADRSRPSHLLRWH